MCTFSFAQIQHGGLPKYLIDQNEIEIHEVDHSMKIENNILDGCEVKKLTTSS